MRFKKDNLVFIPVGGSEQIGINANLYQFNDKWILVDLGIGFPDETQIGAAIGTALLPQRIGLTLHPEKDIRKREPKTALKPSHGP